MFLTPSLFIGPYNIPNKPDAPNSLQDFINFCEKDVLDKLLGSVLYREFVEALFVDPDANPLVPIPEVDIDQKWKDLRDGAEYTHSEKPYRWSGIETALVPYVFQQWESDHYKRLASTGRSRSRKENADVVDPSDNITQAYGDFVRYIGKVHNHFNTLWGFLKANKEVDYVNWDNGLVGCEYKPIWYLRKNSFGI